MYSATDLCCSGEAANGRDPKLGHRVLPASPADACAWLMHAMGFAEARCALIGATAAFFAACGLPAACRLLRCCSCMNKLILLSRIGVWVVSLATGVLHVENALLLDRKRRLVV